MSKYVSPEREAYKLKRIYGKVNGKSILLTKTEFDKAQKRAKRYGW